MDKPTVEEIRAAWMEDSEEFDEVDETADPSWRHGCYMTTIFRRIADDTYWSVFYTVTGDGEHNGLRDGEAEVEQVWPKTVTTIEYVGKNPAEAEDKGAA